MKSIRKNIKNTLRPEFFIEYEQFLKADTMKEYQGLQLGFKQELTKKTVSGNKDDITDLSEASKFLKT